MKVEKINNNKAKITLSAQELKKRRITLNDIKHNKDKAQDFFLELLEDANLLEEFESDTNELFIEACKEDDLLTITVTKMSELASSEVMPAENTSYKISSNIYSFENANDIKEFVNKIHKANLKLPESTLYYFNNKLFLRFKRKTTNTSLFVKIFSILSEYADKYYSTRYFDNILVEYGTVIFSQNDVNQILEYPYFLT